MRKGRDFTSSWWKGRKIFHFGHKKAKRTNRYILWLWKSRENVLALWYINISKTVDLQLLKGMPSSKLGTGMWKRYLLSIEGIGKGWPFLSKMVYKTVRGCRSLPSYKTFLSSIPRGCGKVSHSTKDTKEYPPVLLSSCSVLKWRNRGSQGHFY